jgi:Uma2 family endonuclease
MTTKIELIDLNREYTAEEFAALPDDGKRYELIGGRLVMSPATRDKHGRIIAELFAAIWIFTKNTRTGRIWITTGFSLGKKPNGKDNVLEPDLGFIVAERVPPEADEYLPYPDLAVEVWSPESDLGRPIRLEKAREKLQIYLNAGTRIAWGINPAKQEVEVYHQGQLEPVQVLTLNDELDSEDVIPGFKMKVEALFK